MPAVKADVVGFEETICSPAYEIGLVGVHEY